LKNNWFWRLFYSKVQSKEVQAMMIALTHHQVQVHHQAHHQAHHHPQAQAQHLQAQVQ
jgi:hypothetical protein